MQSAQATSNSMGTSRSWRLWSRPSIPSSSGSASWSRDMIGAGRPARDARSATRRTGIADFRRTCAATVLASGFAVGPPAQAADDWEFAIAPYLLAPHINGAAGLGPFNGGTDVDYDSRSTFEQPDLAPITTGAARPPSASGAT